MRIFLAVVSVVVLAGCIQGPISYRSLTPATGDVAYNCAVRKLNELGYTVTETNKESGFIVADKQTSTWTEGLTGRRHFDRLTVSIFATDSTWRTVRVTAASVQVRTRVSVGDESNVSTRATAKADATAVVTSCTDGVLIGNR